MIIWANELSPREEVMWEDETQEEGARPNPVQITEVQNRTENAYTFENHTAEYKSEHASSVQNVYRTEVHVEVVNHNEIRDASDMERLADRFAEGLREKIYASVEGVYA